LITAAAGAIVQYQSHKKKVLTNVMDGPVQMGRFLGPRNSSLAGKQNGHLKVIGFIEYRGSNEFWLCRCVCGKYQVMSRSEIINGKDRCEICVFQQKMAKGIKTGLTGSHRRRNIERRFVNIARNWIDRDIFDEILARAKKGA